MPKIDGELIKFLEEFAKDDRLFKAENKEHRFLFTAGFIRGVTWASLNQKKIKTLQEGLSQRGEISKGQPPKPPKKRVIREDFGSKKRSW